MLIAATEENIVSIVEILNESYRGESGWTTEKHLVSGNRASKKVIQQEMVNGYSYYLYQHQNELIGCFNLVKEGGAVEIGALAIMAAHQNLGFGKILLHQAEKIACALPNVESLKLSVLAPRKELISFYERRGYRLTKLTYPFPSSRGVGQVLIEGLSVVVMEKNV